MVWVLFPADLALRCSPRLFLQHLLALGHRPQKPQQRQRAARPNCPPNLLASRDMNYLGILHHLPTMPSGGMEHRPPSAGRGLKAARHPAALPASRHGTGGGLGRGFSATLGAPKQQFRLCQLPGGGLYSKEVSWEPPLARFPSRTRVLSCSECF